MSIATRFIPAWGNRRSPAMSFDGNDYLSNSTANFRSADSQGAIEVWFRTTSASQGTLFASSDTAGNTNYVWANVTAAGFLAVDVREGATQSAFHGNTTTNDGKWHHGIVSSNGTTYSLFVDGVLQTLTTDAGTNTGNWFADITGRDNVTLAAWVRATPVVYFTGVIGFTRIYSRPMLQPEAAANFVRGRNAPALNGVGLVFDLPMSEGTGEPTDKTGGLILTRTGAIWTITTARN